MVDGVSGKHAKPSAWRTSPTRTLGIAFGAWIAIAVYLLLLPGRSGFDMTSPDDAGAQGPSAVREDRAPQPRETIRSTPVVDRPSASPSATTAPSATTTAPSPTESTTPRGEPSTPSGEAPAADDGSGAQSAPSEPAPSDEPPGKANGHDRPRGPKDKG